MTNVVTIIYLTLDEFTGCCPLTISRNITSMCSTRTRRDNIQVLRGLNYR